MITRARALNPQVFLELLCYVSFSVLLLKLTYSGKYLTYVTPRMEPYLYFTAIIMLLWAGANAFRLFRPQNRVRVAHCFIPAIPILLLLLPHNPLSASDLSFGAAGGYGYAGGSSFTGPAAQNASASVAQDRTADESPDIRLPDDASAERGFVPGEAGASALIEVEDDAFYAWLNELYMNVDTYVGCRISVTGFVFKDPETLGADEFVPARLGMTCCAADLIPYGFICKYDGAAELESDTWVRVEGVVMKGEYAGFEEPQITVTSVEAAEPVEGYIYPFAY